MSEDRAAITNVFLPGSSQERQAINQLSAELNQTYYELKALLSSLTDSQGDISTLQTDVAAIDDIPKIYHSESASDQTTTGQKLSFTVPAGTYYIKAHATAKQNVGNYSISIRAASTPLRTSDGLSGNGNDTVSQFVDTVYTATGDTVIDLYFNTMTATTVHDYSLWAIKCQKMNT